jgi:hypothetical protein
MIFKYCLSCIQKLFPYCLLKDALTNPTSLVYAACIQCYSKMKASNNKRAALLSLDPNIHPTERVRYSNTYPQPIVQAPLPLIIPAELPPLPPNPPNEPLQAPVTVLHPTEPTDI